MNYLLYGSEEYLISKEIDKIIKINSINKNDISRFDLEEVSLKEIIENALSFNLFSNQRLIIVDNSYVFTSLSKKKDNLKYLEDYLNNPNAHTIIVFKVIYEKIDMRKKIVSAIQKKGKVIEFNNNYNINKIVTEMFDNYEISEKNINYIIDRVGNNLNLLNQEIIKLKVYKSDDLKITREDIDDIVIKTIDTNIFHLVDNILMNNKKEAIESLYEMLKNGEEEIKIIVILANRIRLMYQVKQLKKDGKSIFDMMKILEQKKYTIEKALELARSYKSEILLNNLYKLSVLDESIKSGKIDKKIGLELFILEN